MRTSTGAGTTADKAFIREQAVGVMTLSLACWEQALGKSKLELARISITMPANISIAAG